MRVLLLSMLLLLPTAWPAAALLNDQEPSNDSMSTAAIQISPSASVTTGLGRTCK